MAAYLTTSVVNVRAPFRAAALLPAGFTLHRFAELGSKIAPILDAGLQCVLFAWMLAVAALSLLIAAGAAGLLR